MKPFEYYLRENQVKKQSVDKNLAKSLVEQALRRLDYVSKVEIDESNRDFVLEDYYEVMGTLADAVLALNGYKSYSHEASIAFLGRYKEFSPSLIENFDRIRRLRHGSRYYGERTSVSDAKSAKELAKIIVPKLRKILKL